MAPSVPLTCWTTAAELEAPWPPSAGHACPGSYGQAVLSWADRNLVKFSVVPESDERCTEVIEVLGRAASGFALAMAGSFQLVILPSKIRAISVGVSARSSTPSTLWTTAIGVITVGRLTTVPGAHR